jgi:predicted NUDIX family phosphoesterase
MSEQVLAIPAKLAKELAPESFSPVHHDVNDIILSNHVFLEREAAETNFEFKQVIPYVMVLNTGTTVITSETRYSTVTSYLVSQRTKQQQEKRLHDKYSLGQGGHINDLDLGSSSNSPLVNGLMREISEEFTISNDNIVECVPVGIINDDSNEVSRVHLGVVYMMRINTLAFKIGEEGKHIAQWCVKRDLARFYEGMELWSQIVYNHLIK